MPDGWSMGLSAPAGAFGKDYFATMGMVSLETLWQLLDKEAFHNFDQEGNPKNPASKHDIEAYGKMYLTGKGLPNGGVPPVVVFCPKDKQCFISDGRHRIAAAKKVGLEQVLVTVIEFHPT